jgi:hypothetical protein
LHLKQDHARSDARSIRRTSVKKLALLSAVAALVVAVPASAKKPPGNHPDSHKCTPHNVAWIVSGTLTTWSLTLDTGGKTYSGTVTMNVTRSNRHAEGAEGPGMTFTVTAAHVRFGHGVSSTAPAAGSKIKLIGDVTALAPKCSTTGFTPTVTVERVVLHKAHS